jgi:glycosyltransferase involved in cell wall biosynthesis
MVEPAVSAQTTWYDDTLISVIIPAHNSAYFISRTLLSVLAQSHRALEVIVVDDGSCDDTPAIVEAMMAEDRRLTLVRTCNRGVSAARNIAIAHSQGEFIAPIDADDIWHPDKLALQLAKMRAGGPNVGLIYCWSRGIDENDRVILPAWNDVGVRGSVLKDLIVRGVVGNGSTPLIRRRYIEAVGGYDETMALNEDWKLYTELAAVCEFDFVPEFLTGYRLHVQSASMTSTRAIELAIANTTAWIRATWPDMPAGLFEDRAYTNALYLAFLAIRRGEYGAACHYIVSAVRVRPASILSLHVLRLIVLLPLHWLGLRRYRFSFWRAPKFI